MTKAKKETEIRTTQANSSENTVKEKNVPLGLNKRGNQKKR